MTDNKPIRVFQSGSIRAAIWKNTVTRNGNDVPVYSVQIERVYKDGDSFKRTNRFDATRELPRVQLVVAKAYEFVAMKE